MAMTMIHVTEVLQDVLPQDRSERPDVLLEFPLAMGAGAVDPELIEPHDTQRNVEDLIAFRCSSL